VPRALPALARVVAAAALGAAVLAVVAGTVGVPPGTDALHAVDAVALLVGIGAPTAVGLFLILRRPRTRIAWILLAGALSVAVVMAAFVVAERALRDDAGSALGAWALLVAQEWLVLFAWPLALAYCYPDGRLPSARWKPLAALAVASCGGAMLLLLGQATLDGPNGEVPNPLGIGVAAPAIVALFWACWFGVLISLVGGVLALRARYRAGGPAERRQILWLAYGAVLPPLWLGGTSLIGVTEADLPVLMSVHAWLAVAVAVAVTRHGLYSIDRLFNRTLVYALLTGLLVGTYAAVALVAGELAGDTALSASLGTLAAAIAFRPLRDRIQHLVDRRFARARFEGVRLLQDFLDDVRDGRAEPEDVGSVLALALGDPSAEVLFRLPETGSYADRHGRLVEELADDGRARSTIGRDQRELGVLLHDPALAPDLLHGVLAAAAVAVELARLRVELRLQLAAVESSRARIAQAGYAERRRIERDLHDGAQQRLVTLGIVLRRLQRSLPGDAKVLAPAFDAAVDEVAATIADLRTIAAGVRPPRLDEGLAAALADLARGAEVPVDVEVAGDRAPPDVESAAYFIACEAVTNAVKHASPSRVTVRSARGNGVLRLEVTDDGVGGAAPVAGSGLAGMQDRVAAQGGTLAVDSPAGAGTRIAVELPCGS
jgi:signal transduction histidine kinase